MQARQSHLPVVLPAWPTLLGVQLVLATALGGTWWRFGGGPEVERTPLEAQVLALDLDGGGTAGSEDTRRAALDAALRTERRAARALLADQESRTKSFLSLTATAAGLDLMRSTWTTEPEPELVGVLAADLRVELQGDSYALPAFLDGLHRHSATVRIRAVAMSVEAGGRARAWVDLRYHRPADLERTDLADRVARTVPASSEATRQLLAEAASVAIWREFAAHAGARSAAGEAARRRVAAELPAALVALRLSGGELSWSPGSGVQAQPR